MTKVCIGYRIGGIVPIVGEVAVKTSQRKLTRLVRVFLCPKINHPFKETIMRMYRTSLLFSVVAMLCRCFVSLEAICFRVLDTGPELVSAAVERIVATARSLTTTVTEGNPKPAARSGNSARSHVSLLTAINGHAATA